jgi:hypothetical protein
LSVPGGSSAGRKRRRKSRPRRALARVGLRRLAPLLPDQRFLAGLLDRFAHDESVPDVDGVRHAIDDARQEALIRQQGREAAAEAD